MHVCRNPQLTCLQVLGPGSHDKGIIHTDAGNCVHALGFELLSAANEARCVVLAAGGCEGAGHSENHHLRRHGPARGVLLGKWCTGSCGTLGQPVGCHLPLFLGCVVAPGPQAACILPTFLPAHNSSVLMSLMAPLPSMCFSVALGSCKQQKRSDLLLLVKFSLFGRCLPRAVAPSGAPCHQP